MDCKVCGHPPKKKEGKEFCSHSCRYKFNQVKWVIKFMRDHGTFSWEKFQEWFPGDLPVQVKVLQPELKPRERVYTKKELKELSKEVDDILGMASS